MTPEKWQQVKDILADVLALESAERQSFLEKACGTDTELRVEVEAFLEFENDEESFLKESAFESEFAELSKSDSIKLLGKRIGNYRIISEIGSGGMGAVFLAERIDEEFSHRAAIKFVKDSINSSETIKRFQQERQILASLEHPFIARLLDGGTTYDGIPYLVMEYVKGLPVTEYANQHNLNLEERLNVFRRICQAVEYAHRNLVVHRDLKPSNILITEDGTPKLLDFGIAKLINDESNSETKTRQLAFTPEYASPEQLRSEKLTTSTDIYSLGIVLYELLTGVRPFQTNEKNISQLIHSVTDSEPPRPSSRISERITNENQIPKTSEIEKPLQLPVTNSKALRGDIDNTILKALRKEPERRYLTVQEFSEDIRRHQVGLPITATKDTWEYRTRKFISRNRLAVTAAGIVLLILQLGIATTLYQANIARHERAKAEQRFNDVRQIANSFLFEFHDAIQDLPGAIPARKLVVNRSLEYLDKLATESNNDPTLQLELATAYERIGKIQGNSYYPNLGDTDGAMKSYQRSLEIRQQVAKIDPNNQEVQYELARGYRGVGDMLYGIENLKVALQHYEDGIFAVEKSVAAESENPKYLSLYTDLLSRRGDVKGMEGFSNLGDTQGALESYRQVVEIAEKLTVIEPENMEQKSDYATRLIYFGRLQSAVGDAKGAIESGQKALTILEKIISLEPNNVGYKTRQIIVLNVLRISLLDEGRTTEAIESAKQTIKMIEELLIKDSKNFQLRRGLGVTYNSLGIALRQAKDYKGAIEKFRQSITIAEELFAANPKNFEHQRDIFLAKQLLSEAQIDAGEYDSGLINLRSNISAYEAILKTDNSNNQVKKDLAFCLVLNGKILAIKGNSADAEQNLKRAVLLIDESLNQSPNYRSKIRYALNFSETAKSFKKIAQSENGTKQQATIQGSCNYFKRSFDIWNEMENAGNLSVVNLENYKETSQELSNCSN